MTRKKTRTKRGGGKRRTTRGGREDEDVPDLRTTSLVLPGDVAQEGLRHFRGGVIHFICDNRLAIFLGQMAAA